MSVLETRDQTTNDRTAFARHLRQHPTAAERALWQIVRNRRLGAKFRRQHPIPCTAYIADFACPELMLILELDGEDHTGVDELAQRQRRLDRVRDRQLRRLGYLVERFRNGCVLEAPEILRGVLRQRIKYARHRLRLQEPAA